MKYLLAVDQGTTSSRAVLFDLECRPVGMAQREFPQYFPLPGRVEQEPEEIWRSQLATIREVLARARVSPRDVAAIGITNQRETTLVWERATGAPLHRAIVWQDRRTAGFTDRLRQDGLEPGIRDKTGLVLDPYFSASKMAWLLENVPGLRKRAEAGDACFGTVDSWLMFRLSGGRIFATDATNASRTQLFNIREMAWDAELPDLFGVPRAALPEVKPSSGSFGETDPDLFGHPMEIAGVAGDQQAALFGQACFEPGMAKNTYGTGAFVVMNTGEDPVFAEGILTTLAWRLGNAPPVYALEGSIFVAGAAVQWLRDGLGLIRNAAEVEDLARSVPGTEGVYFVPALTGLGAPWWDPHARGAIVGLTRGTTKAHIARAALEAMAYQTADVIDAMQSSGGIRLRELRVDGGAAANDLLLQFQADVLETPVLRPRGTEVTALGAACLAGLGIGLLDRETIADRWAVERRFGPRSSPRIVRGLRNGWRRAVERSRGWAGPDGPP